MTQVAASPYDTRERRADDLPAILDLMRVSLGESSLLQRTEDMWRWKHEISPFKPSHVLVATSNGPDEGKIVGLRTFLRWEFERDGEVLRGVRAVDTATHPDFRRMGMFKTLTLQAVDCVREQGVDFVFNTPNDQSRPGYLKMGWQTVGVIEPLVKILNYPKFAIGLTKTKLLKRTPSAPGGSYFATNNEPLPVGDLIQHPGLADLVAEDSQLWRSMLRTRRSVDYLDWRYAKHPVIDYKATFIEEDGRLAAAAIFRSNSRFGLREIVLTEMLLSREDMVLARKLLGAVKSHARADYVIGYYPQGTVHHDALRGNRFRRIPGQGMILTANPLSGPLGELEHLDRWGLSLGDVELF